MRLSAPPAERAATRSARGRAGRVLVLMLLAVAGGAEVGAAAPAAYTRHCAVCHGLEGRGDGPAAALLSPRPRNFTTGRFTIRSTPTGTRPTLADVEGSIRDGLPGTSMPPFGDLIDRARIAELARHVLALGAAPLPPGRPFDLAAGPPPGPATVARGARLYRDLGCPSCHGADGLAAGWRPPREGPGIAGRPPALDEPWTFRGGATRDQVALRILTGLDGTAMPAYADVVTAEDARAVADFVATLARRPIWDAADPVAVRRDGVARDPRDRGRYLVNAMLCPLCHTPISPDTGAYDAGRFLAGGMRVSAYPWGTWYSRNLTPDPETGLGRWSPDEVVAAVRTGRTPDGRRLDPMAMPWPWFARLTDEDARAIATYLAALAPVSNPVPPARRPRLPERVGGKLLALLGAETAVEFWGGNAAHEPGLASPVPPPPGRRAVAWAVGGVVMCGATLALIRGMRPPGGGAGSRRAGLRRRRWLTVGVLTTAGWLVLAGWPPVGLMGPETVTGWLSLGAPARPVVADPREQALVARGEYLVTVAPCGLCHTPAGAFVGYYTGRTLAGGMEGRWRVYGRAVSTNLTPGGAPGSLEPRTFSRAVGSGIGADGRTLHWQAMPWDIGSRFTEEDRRAMLAYLRRLPPVTGRVPPPRGPRPGDPPADAFFFGDAADRAP